MSAGIFNEGRLATLPEEVCEYLRPMLDFEHQKFPEKVCRFEKIFADIPKPEVDFNITHVRLPSTPAVVKYNLSIYQWSDGDFRFFIENGDGLERWKHAFNKRIKPVQWKQVPYYRL